MKQTEVMEASIKGNILTVKTKGFLGKVGGDIDLDFARVKMNGRIIKKLGKILKVRVKKTEGKNA